MPFLGTAFVHEWVSIDRCRYTAPVGNVGIAIVYDAGTPGIAVESIARREFAAIGVPAAVIIIIIIIIIATDTVQPITDGAEYCNNGRIVVVIIITATIETITVPRFVE